jgi:hypothetical protein
MICNHFSADKTFKIFVNSCEYSCEICFLKKCVFPSNKFHYICSKCSCRYENKIQMCNCGNPFQRNPNYGEIQNEIPSLIKNPILTKQWTPSFIMSLIQNIMYCPEFTIKNISQIKQLQNDLGLIEKNTKSEENTNNELLYSYHNPEKTIFGCKEYVRGCHIKCPDCDKFVCCRICHDKVEDHKLRRFFVKTMKCNYCGFVQNVQQFCVNCRASMSEYYCGICHLFDSLGTDKKIFHCSSCCECRKCAPEQTVRHCDICKTCVTEPHTCFKYSISDSVCSICGENLHSDRNGINHSKCGHWAHVSCLEKYVSTLWEQQIIPTCPLCRKAIVDLNIVGEILDEMLSNEIMHPELQSIVQNIICNECGEISQVPFHYRFHKCPKCKLYNTQLTK